METALFPSSLADKKTLEPKQSCSGKGEAELSAFKKLAVAAQEPPA